MGACSSAERVACPRNPGGRGRSLSSGSVSYMNVIAVQIMTYLLWVTGVYALWLGVRGNTAHRLVQSADPALLHQADQAVRTGTQPVSAELRYFLRRFFLTVMTQTAALTTEVTCLSVLLAAGAWRWACGLLLAKDLVAVAIGSRVVGNLSGDTVFQRVGAVPQWAVRTDRASALVSGCGLVSLAGVLVWRGFSW